MADYSRIDAILASLPWGPDGHDHEETTNGERAQRAERILAVYEHLVWFNPTADEHDTALGDLLSDIVHLCRRQGLDFEVLARSAYDMHDQEVDEDHDGDMTPATDGWKEKVDG